MALTTAQDGPRGCLGVQGALACSEGSAAIRQELIQRRGAMEQALRTRLERAQHDGNLPPDSDPADLARYFVTVMQGLAVQAASGANREELLRVSQTALRAWPS